MTISKKDLIKRISQKLDSNLKEVELVVDATLEEIYQSLKQGESVNIRNFGTFYIKHHRDSIAFKFNPAQKLRKLFGWSSTYKGEI
ncbi:MAG: HU family DNA-binding protein [Xenococcaceae cyanobacterium MO_167.B52]|nr:HU family DNA-binding protein [Xenococcaceae cyanobacterium MO_167.B52]